MTDLGDSPQLQTVGKFIDAYHALDMNKVEPFISENYQYHPFPDSADLPKTTKEGHIQMFRGILSAVDKVDVTYHEIIEAPGKVIFHVTLMFHAIDGTTLPYDSLMIFTLVEEDGELKILSCKDFADPLKRSAFIAGAAKAAAVKVATS